MEAVSKEVIRDVLRHRLKKDGVYTGELNHGELFEIARRVCDEIEEADPDLFKDITYQIKVTPGKVEELVENVGDEIFRNEINFGRIVGFICFLAHLAARLRTLGHPDYMETVVSVGDRFFHSKLEEWFVMKGSWVIDSVKKGGDQKGKKGRGKKESVKEEEKPLDFSQLIVFHASPLQRMIPFFDPVISSELNDEGGKTEYFKLPRLHFSCTYNISETYLEVGIHEVQDVPPADEDGFSDPYVRVMLLPDVKQRYETTVMNSTLNPVYNETFRFRRVPYEELPNRTLFFQVFDFDLFSDHDMLGECRIPLLDLDLNKPVDMWRTIVPGIIVIDGKSAFRKSTSEYGDICLALRYVVPTEVLTIQVIECKNLNTTVSKRTFDPFVRVIIARDGKSIQSKETILLRSTHNPFFNNRFTFHIGYSQLFASKLVFQVCDRIKFGKSNLLSQLVIGYLSCGPQRRHFQDMLRSPHGPAISWHALQSPSRVGDEDYVK